MTDSRNSDYIPFNRIYRTNEEYKAIVQALDSECWHGDGPASRRVESRLRDWTGSKHVFLTTSCTHALEMAMMALEIERGDEVIMPSFTFVSTANAVRMRGGTPVFAEIRESDLTLDPADTAGKITSSTKAIIPVHYAGVSADFAALRELISGSTIKIVEDAAQGVDAYWQDKALGTIGDIGCYSFHDTKNITCGEGGAFLTQDEELARKAEWIREKGTNRTAFLRGETDKYTWVSPGSSYIPSDLLAALLEAQLNKKDIIRKHRSTVWNAYFSELKEIEDKGMIRLPRIPDYARSNYHIFHFITSETEDQSPLLKKLRDEGIEASFHYIPLHNAPYARKELGLSASLPVTERVAASLIRLPVYPALASKAENIAGRVRDVIKDYYKSKKSVKA
ncbi:dTDP-4-amino-4,6-dideoxygalactose transaminase [Natronogracilivirga saccharolytica]|uniref:dTDP-4-amino-4,6-dideoxygalactose transaminase n=1 Tax=Natronogracilivirga saccharolytica TaxID=2812953 RepID=A0A8J7RLK4_9BACT|nr:dTDP-4-amino-4,6-dideoxygalactose transaminase [Natronogracilivirga saccharolytica]MBP3192363.1 dTDP-4-amino-4,6-dideoxygalactose transaminase [Natronogracilivirga saccharolytica]